MDVNEKIVEEWARLCRRQFTITNIRYRVPRGYGDIDILAFDTDGKLYDYEVKWRSVPWVGTTPQETVEALVHQLLRKERTEAIQRIAGRAPDFRVLITPRGMLEANRKQHKKLISEFEECKIGIIYFEDVLADLVKEVRLKGRYDSEITQVIRMLKSFGYINSNQDSDSSE